MGEGAIWRAMPRNPNVAPPRPDHRRISVSLEKEVTTMDAQLPPRIEQLISERLGCGKYRTVADVIEQAFDALIERENSVDLCEELQRADEQLANGEFTEYD